MSEPQNSSEQSRSDGAGETPPSKTGLGNEVEGSPSGLAAGVEADDESYRTPTPLDGSSNQSAMELTRDANTSFWERLGSPTAAAIIAILALAIALASAATSIFQERLAHREYTIALRQQLVSLVGDISRVPSLEQAAVATYKNDNAALRDVIDAIDHTKLVQAEEAAGIIELLPSEEVTSNEYFVVAEALDESSRDKATPLRFLERAASASSIPRARAQALRQSAKIFYELGDRENIAAAERKMDEAKAVYNGVVFTTSDDRDADLAYTFLFDASFQVHIDCQKAKDEFAEGKRITGGLPSRTTSGSATLLETLPPLLGKC